jgi:hypothetical protein
MGVTVPEAPQEPRPRHAGLLTAHHLGQPATHNVQATLAGKPEVKLHAAAVCADRITEAVSLPALASTGQPTDNPELRRRIEELSRQLAVPPASETLTTSPGTALQPQNSTPHRTFGFHKMLGNSRVVP